MSGRAGGLGIVLLSANIFWAAPGLAAERIDTPLTEAPGDPGRGLATLRDGTKATCLICHSISSIPDPDQGTLGPGLDGVAARFDGGWLRQRIVDARAQTPDTIMPPYYSREGLFRVADTWRGTTVYSAQEVEDVLAFLLTLKD